MFSSPLFLLIIGIVLLFAGGEFIVRGGVSLASNFKISTMVVGITVVSLGTSAPELVVSIGAAFSGHPDIAMGNVVGSNIANIGLVLGLTIVILPVFVDSRSLLFNMLVMLGVTLLLIVFALDRQLVWWEGVILLFLLISFVWFSIRKSRISLMAGIGEIPTKRYSLLVSILIIVVSGLTLVFGARFLVEGASEIARGIGVSERAISVTVIALGTSLPELATSAVAAFRKENDISIGNIIGSNIFNILAILGSSSGLLGMPGVSNIKAIHISDKMFSTDLMVCLGFSILLMILMLPFRKVVLGRIKGIVLVMAYLAYIFMVFSADVI
jgi:cation:H+ antiporter